MKNMKEAAIYCARECARIRGEASTWSYFDDDGEVEVTATPGGKYKTKRV